MLLMGVYKMAFIDLPPQYKCRFLLENKQKTAFILRGCFF
jgi:hypothetical protein